MSGPARCGASRMRREFEGRRTRLVGVMEPRLKGRVEAHIAYWTHWRIELQTLERDASCEDMCLPHNDPRLMSVMTYRC